MAADAAEIARCSRLLARSAAASRRFLSNRAATNPSFAAIVSRHAGRTAKPIATAILLGAQGACPIGRLFTSVAQNRNSDGSSGESWYRRRACVDPSRRIGRILAGALSPFGGRCRRGRFVFDGSVGRHTLLPSRPDPPQSAIAQTVG